MVASRSQATVFLGLASYARKSRERKATVDFLINAPKKIIRLEHFIYASKVFLYVALWAKSPGGA